GGDLHDEIARAVCEERRGKKEGEGGEMSRATIRSLCAAALCAGALALSATPAAAAPTDPLFIYKPPGSGAPTSGFEAPCGVAVDPVFSGFYIADYYHDVVDVFSSNRAPLTQLANVDAVDGPCGLAVDSVGRLYVNDYHRSVLLYLPSSFPPTQGSSFG